MIHLTRRLVFTCLFAVAVSGIVMADEPKMPEFEITLSGSKDTATVIPTTDRVTFSIRSSTGIGRATIARRGQSWPAHAVIRLYVSGLESFQVSNAVSRKPCDDTLTLHAAVASHSTSLGIRRWKNGDDNVLLDSDSPYWMPIKLLDSEAHPATQMPIQGGYVELQLPTIFFAENPSKITLRWIDFYRG